MVTGDASKGALYAERVWSDLALALQDSRIDAVYIATPVFLHASQTLAALHAGKHVLCEKPVALNYSEALAMHAAAEQSKRTLGIAYFRRSFPKVRRALDLVASGAIGKPLLAEISCHEFVQKSAFRGWLFDPKLSGGGPLFDIGSHRIDLLNCFFGQPRLVKAQLSPQLDATTVEENATLLIEYLHGIRGVVDIRWDTRVARDEFRITGTEGELQLSPLSGPDLHYNGVVESLPNHANRHYPCIHNFVDAVLDGSRLHSSSASAIWTDWVTQQAQM